jgi:aldose 1-epimerase
VHSYLTGPNPYFGCVVGRYANRIANARFILNGDTIELNANNSGHSIHGGDKGFSRKIWSVESFTDSTLVLSYFSPDGEEGFPGNLQVKLTYAVTSENELIIDYQATTDKTTVVNLTNHSYFNLSGGKESSILNHELYLNGYQYTEVDSALIPTGNIVELEGGAMDFSCFCRKRIGQDIEQVENGYDHNWILNKSDERLSLAAVVYEPLSGRGMEVRTTQPGIQFYSGNFLKPSIVGKNGIPYQKHAGFCLETQHYPDSPNHPHFPSTILNPNEEYNDRTIYRFYTR